MLAGSAITESAPNAAISSDSGCDAVSTGCKPTGHRTGICGQQLSPLPVAHAGSVWLERVLAELHELGGVASSTELASRCGRYWVRQAAATELIDTSRRGVVQEPGIDDAQAAIAATGGVLCLRSAALAHGWPIVTVASQPEITIPRSRKLRTHHRGLAIHRRDLAEHDIDGSITTPERTVLDCARPLPFGDALAVADSARRSGALQPSELAAIAAAACGPGASRVRHVLSNASAEAANPFESALRALAIEAVGCEFVAQPEATLRDGTVLHPDVGDARRRIAY